MPRDMFVYFDRRMPGLATVGDSLKDYVSDCGDVAWSHDRWIAHLPGASEDTSIHRPNRWIEAYVGPDYVDVMTREQDEFVNAVAEGFVRRLARRFDGRIGDGAV
jgi:hypothetical protein